MSNLRHGRLVKLSYLILVTGLFLVTLSFIPDLALILIKAQDEPLLHTNRITAVIEPKESFMEEITLAGNIVEGIVIPLELENASYKISISTKRGEILFETSRYYHLAEFYNTHPKGQYLVTVTNLGDKLLNFETEITDISKKYTHPEKYIFDYHEEYYVLGFLRDSSLFLLRGGVVAISAGAFLIVTKFSIQKNILLFDVIRRPNNTFREIYPNGEYYFKSSVIILILSSFFTMNSIFQSESISQLPINELGYILDAEIQIIDSVVNILSGFLMVVLIFYVGKRFGGSKNFRGVFSVWSYALIPSLIGGILASLFLYYPPLLEYISGIDSKDSGFRALYWVLYSGIFFPFVIWSIILSVKAVKIANNFGTGKAIGTVVLVSLISYAIWLPFFQLNIINHPYFGQ